MKKDTKSPNTAPQKDDPTIKKDDELREDELNKVTGGGRLVLSGESDIGSACAGAGAGKVTFNPF
jgi:hypothetical protein